MIGTDLARQAPRLIIHGYARAARVPLGVAARVLGHPEPTWAPSLALEQVEGLVEATLGTWLRDEALAEEGRVRQERAAELRAAAEAEAEERHKEEQRDAEAKRQAELHAAKVEAKARKARKRSGDDEDQSLRAAAAAALAASNEDAVLAAVAPL